MDLNARTRDSWQSGSLDMSQVNVCSSGRKIWDSGKIGASQLVALDEEWMWRSDIKLRLPWTFFHSECLAGCHPRPSVRVTQYMKHEGPVKHLTCSPLGPQKSSATWTINSWISECRFVEAWTSWLFQSTVWQDLVFTAQVLYLQFNWQPLLYFLAGEVLQKLKRSNKQKIYPRKIKIRSWSKRVCDGLRQTYLLTATQAEGAGNSEGCIFLQNGQGISFFFWTVSQRWPLLSR